MEGASGLQAYSWVSGKKLDMEDRYLSVWATKTYDDRLAPWLLKELDKIQACFHLKAVPILCPL
jgi:hypothetical protein